MELSFEARVDELELVIVNERETVQAMGEAQRERTVTRLLSGQGATSSLPRPKDGGRAMQRSGALASSIANLLTRNRKGEWVSTVRATGNRPESENVAKKKQRAKAKTKELRAAMAVALTLQSIAGEVDSDLVRKKVGKDGSHFKLSRFKVRAGETNAAIAAILSVPPKDIRGVNGGRGVYRVFEPSAGGREAAAFAARRTMIAKLVKKG